MSFQICPRCRIQVVDGICKCTDPELFRRTIASSRGQQRGKAASGSSPEKNPS